MGVGKRQQAVRAMRGQMSFAGPSFGGAARGPGSGSGQAIARGMSSEDAGS